MSRSIPLKALIATIPLALIVSACGSADAGADAAPAVIDQRQANFKEIGDAFKAIRGQGESATPDYALIASSAQKINANAAKIKDFFPANTSMDAGYDTEALATIWQSPADFAAAADGLVTKSAALVDAATAKDGAAVAAAAKALGGTCKDCHDTFRFDKNK